MTTTPPEDPTDFGALLAHIVAAAQQQRRACRQPDTHDVDALFPPGVAAWMAAQPCPHDPARTVGQWLADHHIHLKDYRPETVDPFGSTESDSA